MFFKLFSLLCFSNMMRNAILELSITIEFGVTCDDQYITNFSKTRMNVEEREKYPEICFLVFLLAV